MSLIDSIKKDLKDVWNVPNILSMIRLLLVGVFVYLFIKKYYVAAVIVFIVAALTDLIDGYIARKYNIVTNFGKLMDPLADKVMLVAALFCLVYEGLIPWWIVVFVLVKELSSIVVGLICYGKGVVVYSQLAGKIASGAFNVAVALTLLKNVLFPFIAKIHLDMIVFYIAIFFTIIALFQYFMQVVDDLKKK